MCRKRAQRWSLVQFQSKMPRLAASGGVFENHDIRSKHIQHSCQRPGTRLRSSPVEQQGIESTEFTQVTASQLAWNHLACAESIFEQQSALRIQGDSICQRHIKKLSVKKRNTIHPSSKTKTINLLLVEKNTSVDYECSNFGIHIPRTNYRQKTFVHFLGIMVPTFKWN